MDLIKITPDKEKAKNIIDMVLLIEERIKLQNKEKNGFSYNFRLLWGCQEPYTKVYGVLINMVLEHLENYSCFLTN